MSTKDEAIGQIFETVLTAGGMIPKETSSAIFTQLHRDRMARRGNKTPEEIASFEEFIAAEMRKMPNPNPKKGPTIRRTTPARK